MTTGNSAPPPSVRTLCYPERWISELNLLRPSSAFHCCSRYIWALPAEIVPSCLQSTMRTPGTCPPRFSYEDHPRRKLLLLSPQWVCPKGTKRRRRRRGRHRGSDVSLANGRVIILLVPRTASYRLHFGSGGRRQCPGLPIPSGSSVEHAPPPPPNGGPEEIPHRTPAAKSGFLGLDTRSFRLLLLGSRYRRPNTVGAICGSDAAMHVSSQEARGCRMRFLRLRETASWHVALALRRIFECEP